jgi:hypothetical protein
VEMAMAHCHQCTSHTNNLDLIIDNNSIQVKKADNLVEYSYWNGFFFLYKVFS